MIRVTFLEREPVECEPNEIEFTASGAVVLRVVEFAEQYQNGPQGPAKVRVPVASRLLHAFSPAAGWVAVEEVGEPEPDRSPLELEEITQR